MSIAIAAVSSMHMTTYQCSIQSIIKKNLSIAYRGVYENMPRSHKEDLKTGGKHGKAYKWKQYIQRRNNT